MKRLVFYISASSIDKLEEAEKPKIINVSSYACKKYDLNLNDLENKNNYNSMKACCQSKLLNIFYLCFQFKNKLKITCNCLCPGLVDSNFGKYNPSFFKSYVNIIKKIICNISS